MHKLAAFAVSLTLLAGCDDEPAGAKPDDDNPTTEPDPAPGDPAETDAAPAADDDATGAVPTVVQSKTPGHVPGRILERGKIACYQAGLMFPAEDDKPAAPVHCETSAVLALDGKLVIASDKPVPGEGLSPVFEVGFDGKRAAPEAGRHYDAAPYVTARKLEDFARVPDRDIGFVTTGFDRVKPESSKWHPYNTLLTFKAGAEDAPVVVEPVETDGIVSSIGIRKKLATALATTDFPVERGGMPYFKTEGLAALPGDRLVFGVREMGKRYDDFSYVVRLVEAGYTVEGDTVTLDDTFKVIYDFDAKTDPRLDVEVGLSSVEYDAAHDRLLLLTSFEKEETDEGLGAYLWVLPRKDLEAHRPPQLVVKDDGQPLVFAHKGEGVTVVDKSHVLVVHDDDRVTGRETIDNPETQFSRLPHETSWTLVELP